jgi:hypothetical protein
MDKILGKLKWQKVLVYIDDINIYTKTNIDDHLNDIREVFERLRAAGLTIKLSKCWFAKESVKFLGFIVSREGLLPDPEKVKSITEWPIPTTVTHIKQFLGLVNYYRRFIENCAALSQPLNSLSQQNVTWNWGTEQQEAFDKLKVLLTTAPILQIPDFEAPFIVHCDASNYAIGAILAQETEQGEHVIMYASRSLSATEVNYSTTEKECLAVVWSLQYFRPYIWWKNLPW